MRAGIVPQWAADLRILLAVRRDPRLSSNELSAIPVWARDEKPLAVELIDSIAALHALRSDYDMLNRACGNTSPFALFDWHLAWCTHFMNLDPNVADRLAIYLMRDADGICIAIVPLIASTRRVGPISLVTLDLLGADPSTTESRRPLVLPGYEGLAIETLREHLAADSRWDWITWRNISGPLLGALAQAPLTELTAEAPGYLLDLAPTWEKFHAGLKRNIRESLRHCYNSLKRDGHEFSMEIASDPEAVRIGIDRFLALHALRADLSGTVDHPNHFSSAVARRFLYEACDRLADRGVVRVFQMRIADEIVAARIGFVVGDTLYMYYSGFEPRWARYSVMTTTIAEAIKFAIGTGLKFVNLSRGTDNSKTRWGPRSIEYAGVVERRDRLLSRVLHAVYSRAREHRGLQSWLLRHFGRSQRRWR